MISVSLYRVPNYDVDLLTEKIHQIIEDQGGYSSLFSTDETIVIKPNLVSKKKPEACATTHPAVLEATLRCLLPHTKNILVAECPGGPNGSAALEGIYRETGIGEVCERYGIPWVKEMKSRAVSLENPLSSVHPEVLEPFARGIAWINLAKAKTHSLTTVTGAAKNLYGTVPGLRKVEYHALFPKLSDFCGFLLDLNRAVPPRLSLVDGIMGMEGNGPGSGDPRFLGALFGSRSTLAADEAMCRLMGISSSLSPLLCLAKEKGYFDGEIQWLGDVPELFSQSPFRLPDSQRKSPIQRLPEIGNGKLAAWLAPYPAMGKDCIGCGECLRLCPQKAIELRKGRAKIARNRCIRCWCCQELCPKKAVIIRRNPFLKGLD